MNKEGENYYSFETNELQLKIYELARETGIYEGIEWIGAEGAVIRKMIVRKKQSVLKDKLYLGELWSCYLR